MSCSHPGCYIHSGCGIKHPGRWKPTVTVSINGSVFGGDDMADCAAHYLLSLGYPTDQPTHLRNIAEKMAARWGHHDVTVDGKQRRIVTQK